jgi:hypothetical protein
MAYEGLSVCEGRCVLWPQIIGAAADDGPSIPLGINLGWRLRRLGGARQLAPPVLIGQRALPHVVS